MAPNLCIVAAGLLMGLASAVGAAETLDRTALTAMPVEIVNSSPDTILCEAEIAHWFALELARIPAGERATLDLRFHDASGAWAAMNALGEALPVERAWCGIAGRSYETRQMLTLQRAAPAPQSLDCRSEAGSLVCD